MKAGHYGRRHRREFLDFMNEIVAEHQDEEIHVIMDNLNTINPKGTIGLNVIRRSIFILRPRMLPG